MIRQLSVSYTRLGALLGQSFMCHWANLDLTSVMPHPRVAHGLKWSAWILAHRS